MLVNIVHTALAASAALIFAVEARYVVFTEDGPSRTDALTVEGTTSCFSYHGCYSDGPSTTTKDASVSVYIVEDDCGRCPEEWLDSGSIVPLSHGLSNDDDAILHIQRAALATSGGASTTAGMASWADELAHFMEGVCVQAAAEKRAATSIGRAAQRVLFAAPHAGEDRRELDDIASLGRPQLLHRSTSGKSAFFSIPRALLPIADYFFPSSAVLVSVSPDPLPLPRAQTARAAPAWLNETLSKLHYSPLIDALIADIDPAQIKADVRHLTGEDGKASWRTRHSFTTGGAEAAKWIKATVEKEAGPGVECVFHEHNEGFNPNVICTFKGTTHPDELVILGAHYDSRGSFGHVRAPGGDDDASGVSALLSLARLFHAYHLRFKHTVVLAFFSGEEQGLWGSRVYAKHLRELQDEGAKSATNASTPSVLMMLQADMLGYREAGEPMQLARPDKYDTIEARWLIGNISTLYVPDLVVGETPACCSDHQSFDQQGFVSTWVFERNGPIADPKYHNSGDLSDRPNYDFDQIAAIAKVMFATVLICADFNL